MVVVNTTNNTWARVGHQTDRAASPMVTLVTAEACHLCEDAHTELLNRATQGQLLLDQVDAESPQGQKLLHQHRPAMSLLAGIGSSPHAESQPLMVSISGP